MLILDPQPLLRHTADHAFASRAVRVPHSKAYTGGCTDGTKSQAVGDYCFLSSDMRGLSVPWSVAE